MIKNEERKGFEERYTGPYVITEVINKWTYKLYSESLNKVVQRNYNQVKKLNPDESSRVSSSIHTTVQSRRKKESEKNKVSIIEDHRYPIRSTRNPNPVYQ